MGINKLSGTSFGLLVLLLCVITGCRDNEVTNLNDPDLLGALSSPSEVEALISSSFYSYWKVTHRRFPNAQFSAAADAHSSSWGGWGFDSGREPRGPFDNSPSYGYRETAENPWDYSYAALAAVRDGLRAISEGGIVIREDGRDVTPRAVAFGKLVQALCLSSLAVIFDRAFLMDEGTDLAKLAQRNAEGKPVHLIPYQEVWEAAEAKYAEAISVAQAATFTIPAEWVGRNAPWSDEDFVAFARAFRARFRTEVPRTPQEREAVDWNSVLADLSDGLPFPFGSYNDGVNGSWWDRKKMHSADVPGWARMDNRTLGPADVSGEWEKWIHAEAYNKAPFDILTPDARITQPMQPKTDGKYFTYMGTSPFPASRGIYHFGNYIDHRYAHLMEADWIGFYEDFTDKEVDFLRAEALYRTGDRAGAREIVNRYRANGDLPPFTGQKNPDGPDRCVPQMPDGSCGDLWEALKYEKRIECFHASFGMEFFDDRGWGDLVEDTYLQLPVPGRDLLLLMQSIYTFGGPGGQSAAPGRGVTPDFIDDVSSRALSQKRRAFEAYLTRTDERIDPGPPHR